MNLIKLSKRLMAVANCIENTGVHADIGSDHAYLPIYLLENNFAKSAIAGEVVRGPYESSVENVRKQGVADKISVRLGSGLEVIEHAEADSISICGMGGALISDILEAGKEKLSGKERLILQPNIGGHIVRKWLNNNGWKIINEKILEEDNKIYEIIVAEKGEQTLSDAENLLGPFLKVEKNETFMKKWNYELQHLGRILENLEKSTGEESGRRKEAVMAEIELIKAVFK